MTTLTARQIARVAYDAGFRGERLVTAVAIAIGESDGRVEIVNSIGCVGLWQINQPVHVSAHPKWTRAWLQNAAHNAEAAAVLSGKGANWNPWSVYTSGSYKSHMAAARAGAQGIGDPPPGGGGGRGGGKGGGKDDDGKGGGKDDTDNPRKPPKPPRAEPDPDPRVRLGQVIVHGGKLRENITQAVTGASLTWSVTEVTQLALTVADPGFDLWRDGVFAKGVAVAYREPGMKDLSLRVTSINLDGGAAGTGGFTVNCRSEGVWKLKKRRGSLVMKKASPTEFVEAECKAAGLKCVAQPSSQRGQVKRDIPAKGDDSKGSEKPSSWTTFQRLATELGYVVFEFMDTVYFGKPTWLIERDKEPMQVAIPLPGAPEVWAARAMPVISDSEDSAVPLEVSQIIVDGSRIKECRPGGALRLRGLPPYNTKLMVTAMTLPLIGPRGLEVTAATPVNPDPQPPPKPAKKGSYDDGYDGDGSGGSGGATQAGSRSALDFVTMAISASNASYVFGAEASISDATPSALDCSELVQWALGRIGISFVDGSSAQYAASHKISVATAMRTRGALLWKEGHIGISLGDGRSVEARNPSDGVGIFRAADIAWQGGGLVPGVRYG